MIGKLKARLYFPIASYFLFWAKIKLSRWNPRIVVITGSSGKTTLLSLIESQLGEKAKYSHHANSTYGIPFDILGFHRKDLTVNEWLSLFFLSPFKAFTKTPKEKIYIVEADCDRPHEGEVLSSFLKPEVTLWISSSRTHSMNFDQLVKNGQFKTVNEAIAYEFGWFIQNTKKLILLNGDNPLIMRQLSRTQAEIVKIRKENTLNQYRVLTDHSEFQLNKKVYSLPAVLPEDAFYSLDITLKLMAYFKLKPNSTWSQLKLPPGRSSVFKGIKQTTLVDSSYNANLDSMSVILDMYGRYPGKEKWAVISDILEQGNEEKEEHEKLAALIARLKLSRLILMGPRIVKYTYPLLRKLQPTAVIVTYESPKDVLDYLQANLQGHETILFKGARFLEGVIEHMLVNKNDINKLCRREKIWQIRRKKWGL